ncbi:TetR/AcrR family transcriptional regulator [Cohnella thermotolerans]|uniref:TetR/AcrR family transcriptional regulator n=1 Tax=Cohnella thermotolerans TaxID=329858 RepID=UPI00040BFC14|nr:TetR family transcriptional regulator [Cohnella thermotolerans]
MYTNDSGNKTDLRVRRTRKLLWESLMSLLEYRSFESLSVQEICDNAMVHRTTFYKHFRDKYQLLAYGLEEAREKFASRSYKDRILRPMQMFEEMGHMRQFQTLLNAEQRGGTLGCIMQKHAEDSLKRDLTEAEKKGVRFPVPVDVIAAFYSGAIAALGAWWLRHEAAVSAQEMDEYLGRLINFDTFFPETAK